MQTSSETVFLSYFLDLWKGKGLTLLGMLFQFVKTISCSTDMLLQINTK